MKTLKLGMYRWMRILSKADMTAKKNALARERVIQCIGTFRMRRRSAMGR